MKGDGTEENGEVEMVITGHEPSERDLCTQSMHGEGGCGREYTEVEGVTVGR